MSVDNVGPECDAAFKLYDGAGKLLITVDDYSKGHLETLRYTMPADGMYYLKVYNTDLVSCSTGNTVYSVAVTWN